MTPPQFITAVDIAYPTDQPQHTTHCSRTAPTITHNETKIYQHNVKYAVDARYAVDSA